MSYIFHCINPHPKQPDKKHQSLRAATYSIIKLVQYQAGPRENADMIESGKGLGKGMYRFKTKNPAEPLFVSAAGFITFNYRLYISSRS